MLLAPLQKTFTLSQDVRKISTTVCDNSNNNNNSSKSQSTQKFNFDLTLAACHSMHLSISLKYRFLISAIDDDIPLGLSINK